MERNEYTIEILGEDGRWIGPVKFFSTDGNMVRRARAIHKRYKGTKSRIWGMCGGTWMVVNRLIHARGEQTLWRF